MSEELKQPPREPLDGAVVVRRWAVDGIEIVVTTMGVTRSVVMSGYNAWRVFGMLAMTLKMPIAARLMKAIKL